MNNGTNITMRAPVTTVSMSHSLKCPLGGGFWIYSPEHRLVDGCTEGGIPLCQCGGGTIQLTFADGTSVSIRDGHSFLEKLRKLADRPDAEARELERPAAPEA
jgi:hypothetical protein